MLLIFYDKLENHNFVGVINFLLDSSFQLERTPLLDAFKADWCIAVDEETGNPNTYAVQVFTEDLIRSKVF